VVVELFLGNKVGDIFSFCIFFKGKKRMITFISIFEMFYEELEEISYRYEFLMK
jgi:hypothetical protein